MGYMIEKDGEGKKMQFAVQRELSDGERQRRGLRV